MNLAINTAVVALVGVLIVFVCFGCLFLGQLTRTAAELPGVADQAIAREGLLTRQLADRQITALSTRLEQQVTELRHDLFAQADSIEGNTFHELAAIRADANQQIALTRTDTLAELSKITSPAGATITALQEMIPPAKNIVANASETSDLLLSCDHNVDCLANRLIPALKSTEKMAKAGERTMNAVADATPATAAAIQSTSSDLAKIVKKFSQPVSWVKGALGTAARIAGKFLGL